MWEQSLLTSAGQVEALRLLTNRWDSSGRRALWGRRQAGGAPDGRVADVLLLPPGYTPAHLDERLAEVS